MKNKGMAPAGQPLLEQHEADMKRLTPAEPPLWVQIPFYLLIGWLGGMLLEGLFGFLDRHQFLP